MLKVGEEPVEPDDAEPGLDTPLEVEAPSEEVGAETTMERTPKDEFEVAEVDDGRAENAGTTFGDTAAVEVVIGDVGTAFAATAESSEPTRMFEDGTFAAASPEALGFASGPGRERAKRATATAARKAKTPIKIVLFSIC